MNKIHFPSINGLRAVSIIIVILSHFDNNFVDFRIKSDSLLVRSFIDFLYDGNFAVNIFFVVSGFLIASISIHEEKQFQRLSVKKFYFRRSLRIFPAYFFLLFIYLILQSFDLVHFNQQSWITSLTFTKYTNWINDHLTSHLWSLSIEEQFYIIFPFIFIGGNNFRKSVIIILFFTMPLFRVTYHFTKLSYMTDLSIFTRLDAILIGCFCAFYKDEIIEKLNKYWKLWFYFSIVGLFCLRFLYLFAFSVDKEILFLPFGATFGTFSNILIAIIVMYSIFGPKGKWYLFLNCKIISFIGMISYGIYLWQQFFTYGKFPWLTDYIFIRLLFIFAMALFSYYIIEKPFLKLKSKISYPYTQI